MKMQKFAIFAKKNLKTKISKIKSIIKLAIIVTIEGNIEVLRIAYENWYIGYLKIPIDFQNLSNYDYHSNIKDLAEELKKKLTCLVQNTKKYIIFAV